jgi:hypothetical protein
LCRRERLEGELRAVQLELGAIRAEARLAASELPGAGGEGSEYDRRRAEGAALATKVRCPSRLGKTIRLWCYAVSCDDV